MAGAPTIAALFAQRVVVGVGDLGVSNNSSLTLSTYALGSCVGVVAYDPVGRIGGLLHLMLPDSSLVPGKAANQPAMFADTGLPLLFRALSGLKAERSRLRLFVAGGANVLGTSSDNFKIGERNLRAVSTILAQGHYQVRHSEVSGTVNRTVHLEIATGLVRLKTPLGEQTFSLAG